jgi:hypothetical protein
MASPLRRPHAIHHPALSCGLCVYKGATPGIELLDNATTILGPASEPQPDLSLRILPAWGGRSQTDPEEYILAYVAHNVAKVGPILRFFTGKTGVLCSGNSQPI